MSTDKKYNIRGFLAELMAKAKEGEGIDVVLLRDEINKEIEAEEKTFGKFLGLQTSLQDDIPDEKQRFNVAIKVLSATSGVSRQNIVESINNQLEELKAIENGILSGLPGFRDELKSMESRSKEIRDEIAKLSGKIMQLEKEDQVILSGIATREREMKVAEEAVNRVFTDIGARITDIRKKIENYTAEKVSPQPIKSPDSAVIAQSGEESGEGNETEETSAQQETKWQKKCSLCGGQMHFHINESMWMCYTCGHEEPEKGDTDTAGEPATASEPALPAETIPAGEPATALEPVPPAEPISAIEPASAPEQMLMPVASAPKASSPSENKPSPRKKVCPVCRKQMNWTEKEKSWICPSCGYRRMVF